MLWLAAMLLCAALALAGCAGDDDDNDSADDDGAADDDDADDDDADDDDDNDDDNDTGDDDDDNDDNDDDETPPTDTIHAYVYDILTSAYLQGVTCELVKNADGSSFSPAITTTSDASGLCAFNDAGVKGEYSVKFTKNAYPTHYAFKYDAARDWYFPLTSNLARTSIALLLGVTLDSSKGVLSGKAIWYADPSEPIGCATAADDAGDQAYYFSDAGLPTTDRTDTNPANGYYLFVNVDPGANNLTVTLSNDDQGTADVPMVFADAIIMRDVLFSTTDYPTNPTPGDCE
jgi:hypothetical protein